MIEKITLTSGFAYDYSKMFGSVNLQPEDVEQLKDKIKAAHEGLFSIRTQGVAKNHLSKDGKPEPVYFTRLPFIDEPNPNNPTSIKALQDYGQYLWENTENVIFLGIGGSYLGNKVLFDLQAGNYWNQRENADREGYPKVYFAGNNVDEAQSRALLEEMVMQARYKRLCGMDKLKIMLVAISKSGTTLETTAGFLYFYEELQKYVGLIQVEVTVVTDLSVPVAESPLHQLALEYNWHKFDVKEGVGGRFSVFSEPGLVTAVAVGLDVEQLLAGARDMELACQSDDPYTNPALMNAVIKYIAAEKYGCDIEVLMPYSMKLKSLSEWYVQLLAESLGKRCDRQGQEICYGRTPIAAVGTTDMHAQTQQHQDGRRNKVVQFIQVKELEADIVLHNVFPQIQGYNKYEGMKMQEALCIALEANEEALNEDNRMSARYILPRLNAYYLGQLLYFLMLSVAYEGELADVDAYDQPGVEAYKRIMKAKLAT